MCATLSTGLTEIGAVVEGIISAPSGGSNAGIIVPRCAQVGALAGQIFCRAAMNCAKKCQKEEDCKK
jgi:hypothetical protein